MKCKKCRKQIPDDAKFCCYCGQKVEKGKMYRRPDGLYEKVLTIDGKRVYFRAKTEREVERKIVEFQGVKERGPLFREVADEWEEEHFPTLAYNTLKVYKPAKRRACEFFQGYIKDITAKDVEKYLNQLPKTWAQKTFQNHLLVLNLIFEYAARNGVIDVTPTSYTRIPKGKKKDPRRALTHEEIEIIKSSVEKPFGLFAFLLLYTGCRRGEALALQYRDIDRNKNIIHITKSVYHEGNSPKIKSPKTEKGMRDIVLLDILKEKIPDGKSNDFIFGGDCPLTSSKVEDLWKEYQRETGLDITPHNIRHGYASMLHEAGIDQKDAQALLGHANISTTMDIYTHITESAQRETAKKLNEFTKNTQ